MNNCQNEIDLKWQLSSVLLNLAFKDPFPIHLSENGRISLKIYERKPLQLFFSSLYHSNNNTRSLRLGNAISIQI